MAKRRARQARTWEGRVWRTVGTSGNRLGSPDRERFPDWIKDATVAGYTRVRITEVLPKSKKGKKNAKA